MTPSPQPEASQANDDDPSSSPAAPAETPAPKVMTPPALVEDAAVSPAERSMLLAPVRWVKQKFFGEQQDIRQSLDNIVSADFSDGAAANLTEDERTMIRNILQYHEVRVDDVMVPRADIIAFDDSEGFEALVSQFLEAAHSRIPVFSETLDHVVGMVHIKDIVRPLTPKVNGQQRRSPSVSSLLRSVLYVPPSMRVIDLLARMRAARVHMAIVVDEFGGTDGLITIEDLVEQIVGDIEDEHDMAAPDAVQELAEGIWLADARLPIEKLEETLGQSLRDVDDEMDVDTLGGLVVCLSGSVPIIGEQVHHDAGFSLEVIDGDPRRIKQVRISRDTAPPVQSEE